MKKRNLKFFAIAWMCMLIGLSFTSCSDEPQRPESEVDHKLHDDPYTAVLTLASGHFHGLLFHEDSDPDGAQYLKTEQTITFTYVEGKGWRPAEGSDTIFRVFSGDKAQNIVSAYGLWIRYYNKKGEDITGQFVENNQDQIHQHFFTPRDVKPITLLGAVAAPDDADPSKMFEYTYMDTTPWDKTLKDEGTQCTGGKNPVGLKGYFSFLKDRRTMTLRIRLMHARTSKFHHGVASPFYAPTPGQLASDHWDLEMDVPVVVLCSRGEEQEWESVIDDYNQLTDAEKRVIDAIASGYGISQQDALAAFNLRITGDYHSEGGRWF